MVTSVGNDLLGVFFFLKASQSHIQLVFKSCLKGLGEAEGSSETCGENKA